MNRNGDRSWVWDITRQVYGLIALVVILVFIVVAYIYYSYNTIAQVVNKNTNYHLVAKSHYLQAMQELRNLQGRYSVNLAEESGHNTSFGTIGLVLKESNHAVQQSLIQQHIDRGLSLEQSYADARFENLAHRLADRAGILSQLYTDHIERGGNIEQILATSRKLLVNLDQLVRLHTIIRDDNMHKLNDRENFQVQVFYFLLFVLLVTGLALTRKGFTSIRQIAEKQLQAEDEIRHRAHFDSLTGLPNRFLSQDRLSQLMKEAERSGGKVAVVFVDLDFFKKVNDMLGHASGDRLLIDAARRISKSVRAGDTVGRLGGDEFIVLGGGIADTAEVANIAENLINCIGEPFTIDGREINLSASVGISIFPDDSRDGMELIGKADTAMFHSKQLGRSGYSYFTESMNRHASRQLSLEQQLRGALERGEFEVFYQQKVEINSNRIIGAEALLRWNNPELGAVAPAEFIPVAEQTGLIISIGEFALNQALRQTRQWQERYLPDFRIAVNLSPRQFRNPDLINNISRSLHESGVKSSHLELEITEGVLMSDHMNVDEALDDLNKLGVSIAMDDFGTGYSSLSYLRKYSFDVIKIDRSFIADIDVNLLSHKLIHAAIAMARALNIDVVAEGVETRAQLSVLKQFNCQVAQGYFFGKPVDAIGMEALLKEHNGDPEGKSGNAVVLKSV
jgi:diguanylate cyclase (GGDEF)-like protein